jgi:tRNA-Thr(GGU) m(6)t(6)A37 methyltransferase TsaA
MSEEITIKPIGTIHTPYDKDADIPIQGRFRPDASGWVELDPAYAGGLRDLDGFSHAFLLYHLHASDRVTLAGTPFLENRKHGIFAIRSPHRPNHIGMSVVAIERIEENCLYFRHVDMLDGTPLLDIKPYVTHFDCFPDARCGWIDKHFARGQIPEAAKKNSGIAAS